MAKLPLYSFDWDAEKARGNLKKHAVSFEEAAGVFRDAHATSLLDARSSLSEERWVTLGMGRMGRLLVVVHIFEDLGEDRFRVRIISAREVTKRERQAYEAGL